MTERQAGEQRPSISVAQRLATGAMGEDGVFLRGGGQFPSCATGRCVEVLYGRGASFEFRVAASLRRCVVLGVLPWQCCEAQSGCLALGKVR